MMKVCSPLARVVGFVAVLCAVGAQGAGDEGGDQRARSAKKSLEKHPVLLKLRQDLDNLRLNMDEIKSAPAPAAPAPAPVGGFDAETVAQLKSEIASLKAAFAAKPAAPAAPAAPTLAPVGAAPAKSLARINQITGEPYMQTQSLNSADRKRILITGGAGFVGSHLTDVLMKEGHEVTIIDNFFTGRKKNVEHWIGHPNFELVMHDVVEPFMIEVDEIYHLASPASPPHYMYNPIKTIKTNSIGTINMLGLANRVGARLLLASTSEVYGDPEVHPQVETYRGNVNTIGPRACYDEAKRIAETLCFAYKQQGNVQVRIARIFNTFGPRMNMGDGRVVSNFVIQALQGKDITVYGTGNQTRSFQYVSDLVAGLVALMNGNYSYPVNLGNPDEYTMLQFAETIIEITNSSSKIVYKPLPKDDPMRRRPDITRAKMKIGWQPVTTVRKGLQEAIKYFAKELSEVGDPESSKGAASHKAGPYGHLADYAKNSQAGDDGEL